MYIVSVGSIDLGYAFIGPFNSETEAQGWINQQDERIGLVAWPIKLRVPDAASKVVADVSTRIPAED